MSSPYVAEIRVFPFNFAPVSWAFCNGQLLSISSNTALFSLLGTNYGGNGSSTFGLPNLQGAVPMHTTSYSSSPLGTFPIGATGGEASLQLLISEIPSHTHTVQGDLTPANALYASPSGTIPANATPTLIYSTSGTPQTVTMNPSMIGVTGSSSAHNNLMPYLTLNYCICLQGVYPPRS
ncbi:MAG TPA: tail fiber protein [Candidatus Sulfotelmatobacter sp.]|nr:tail fiber protein [Candidatus Sulfotelmatobacter sp.]